MNSKRLLNLSAILTLLVCSACVSVDLGLGKAQKADGITFASPTGHFKKISNSTVDSAWQDSVNGNTLAFLSECNSKTDLTLKTIEAENLAALTNIVIVESKDFTYNDRDALRTIVNGQVDGVPVRMEVVIFKKNNCNYTLSFVGREKYFKSDEAQFNNFVEGFRAP
jgi:hypothetical protein